MSIEQAEQRASQATLRITSQAQSLVIETDDDFDFAGEVLKIIVEKKKELDAEDFLGGMKRAAYQAWNKANSIFNKYAKPLETAEGIIKNKMLAFDNKRKEEKRQRELAESEKKRLEMQQKALDDAALLESQGEPELAAMVMEEAATAPPPVVVMPSAPKTEGISTRQNWKWRHLVSEEETLRLIVKAAAEDERYLPLLMLNTKNLNSKATSDKSLMRVPGVQAYDAGGISVRA